ncbi:MAG: GxxExxY protein [Gemmatimonadota bacterium]
MRRSNCIQAVGPGLHETFRNICRLDLAVENMILVEVKSFHSTSIAHRKQMHTYLRIVDFN